MLMTKKRYYEKHWEESYYVFDSNIISEDEFDERVEYEGYDVFVDSLIGNEIIDLLNENEQLKQSVNNLKDTIIKITIAYQRKYDRTIIDLVDEVHDEDITDLIKELEE